MVIPMVAELNIPVAWVWRAGSTWNSTKRNMFHSGFLLFLFCSRRRYVAQGQTHTHARAHTHTRTHTHTRSSWLVGVCLPQPARLLSSLPNFTPPPPPCLPSFSPRPFFHLKSTASVFVSLPLLPAPRPPHYPCTTLPSSPPPAPQRCFICFNLIWCYLI